ncbi:MAG: TIM44-like domain-containing protein [Bacteroidetes bacterium]|nr:TIM44-like domain-containing protein [Bacteroidota bacterium]
MRYSRTIQKIAFFSFGLFFISTEVLARAGGGGGGGSSSGGGGGWSGGGSYDYDGGGSGGSIDANPIHIVLIVIAVFAFYYLKNRGNFSSFFNNEQSNMPNKAMPEGLDTKKIQLSFMGIQDAWQKKELKSVRRWISDGVYQRFNAQFAMMNKLQQTNYLSNIKINAIKLANTQTDGKYQTADVAIFFTMDDEFISDKYKSFNQKYKGESAMEYWTFIKKSEAHTQKNLYDNNNCPNCGAPFDVDMGEISRCSSCGTLTNNASYDWVLSEITQENDYTGNNENYEGLRELTQGDDLFSIQRIQDIASNVFMQTMEVLSGADNKKLSRFADEATTQHILQLKKQWGSFVFDRLYLNTVDIDNYQIDEERLHILFSMKATYQRVQAGEKLSLIDSEMVSERFYMVLSKNKNALQTTQKETVYSHECTSCGAPYTDTTNEVCPYCQAPVLDFNKNWVLTAFKTA